MISTIMFALLAVAAPQEEFIEEIDTQAVVFEDGENAFEDCLEEIVFEEEVSEDDNQEVVVNDEE